MEELVKLQVEDGIATVTLNRPEKYNALNQPLLHKLRKTFDELAWDERVRVVVITGAGEAFCAGGDVVGHPDFSDDDVVRRYASVNHDRKWIQSLLRIPCPVITAINGWAVGAGADMVWASDLRIASEKATFVEAFTNLGLMPNFGGTYLLQRNIGMARAMELILMGEPFTAKQAESWGLINRAVPHDQLYDVVYSWARKLAAKSPHALARAKESIWLGTEGSLNQALQRDCEGQNFLLGTPELREAVAKFVARRKEQEEKNG